jgi:16S rRNA (uracil1498-N3)-methyltransferase
MHRCYVPDPIGDTVIVPADEAHHLVRVLRLDVGADLVVFDGRGHEWDARVESASRQSVAVRLIAPRVPVAEPPVAVTLAVGWLKGDQIHGVVRDATALGVAAVQLFVSSHVAVPERAWRDRSIERWRRVAIAAAKQCGRAVVPEIREVVRYTEMLDGSDAPLFVCVEPARGQASTPPAARPDRATLVVGPEGGWSTAELDEARARGALLLGLGPRTLRAEIAPTVALATLWTRWGWR